MSENVLTVNIPEGRRPPAAAAHPARWGPGGQQQAVSTRGRRVGVGQQRGGGRPPRDAAGYMRRGRGARMAGARPGDCTGKSQRQGSHRPEAAPAAGGNRPRQGVGGSTAAGGQ